MQNWRDVSENSLLILGSQTLTLSKRTCKTKDKIPAVTSVNSSNDDKMNHVRN